MLYRQINIVSNIQAGELSISYISIFSNRGFSQSDVIYLLSPTGSFLFSVSGRRSLASWCS